MALKKAEIRLYFGPTGCGKSYLMKQHIGQMRQEMQPVNWYSQLKGHRPARPAAAVVAHDIHGEWEGIADVCMASEAFEERKWDSYPPGTVLVIDEADRVAPVHASRKTEAVRLPNYCRHREYVVMVASRRPAALHRDYTAMCSEAYFFAMTEKRDLAYIADCFGEDIVNQMANLGQYEFVRWQR